jgi:hypothetical protein
MNLTVCVSDGTHTHTQYVSDDALTLTLSLTRARAWIQSSAAQNFVSRRTFRPAELCNEVE